MIRLENIQRHYVSDEVETTALADIDLVRGCGRVPRRSWGRPAAANRPCSTRSAPSIGRAAGRYVFGEQDLATLDEAALARFRASTLGFVFQSFNLIDELTIAENVELGLIYRKDGGGDRKARIAAAMDQGRHLAPRPPFPAPACRAGSSSAPRSHARSSAIPS